MISLLPDIDVDRRPPTGGGWLLLLFFCLAGPTALAADVFVPEVLQGRQLEQRIDELQAGGPYQPSLIEALAELAAFHEARGDHADAAAFHAEALQVSRVNNGLYHEQQVALLQRLVDNHRALGQWQQVDDFQQLLFFTRSRLHGAGSAERRQAVLQFGDWRLESWQRNLRTGSSVDSRQVPAALQDIWTLYEQSLEDPDIEQGERFELLYGRARVELAIARHMAEVPLRAFEPSTPRYTTQRVCRNVVDQNGVAERVCWSEQVENPAYRSALRDERRTHMDRATLRFRRTVEVLETLAETEAGERQQEVASLQSQVSELQQASRRAQLRGW